MTLGSLVPRAGLAPNVQTSLEDARVVASIAPIIFKSDAMQYQAMVPAAPSIPSWVIPVGIAGLVLLVVLSRRSS
jgi:hypothetical protein